MWRVIAFLVCIGVVGDLVVLDGQFIVATVHSIKDVSDSMTQYMVRRF